MVFVDALMDEVMLWYESRIAENIKDMIRDAHSGWRRCSRKVVL